MSLLPTCSINVKVGWLGSHIACGLQPWTSGLNFVGVAHGFSYIHHEGAFIDVLTSEKHLNLGKKTAKFMSYHWKSSTEGFDYWGK